MVFWSFMMLMSVVVGAVKIEEKNEKGDLCLYFESDLVLNVPYTTSGGNKTKKVTVKDELLDPKGTGNFCDRKFAHGMHEAGFEMSFMDDFEMSMVFNSVQNFVSLSQVNLTIPFTEKYFPGVLVNETKAFSSNISLPLHFSTTTSLNCTAGWTGLNMTGGVTLDMTMMFIQPFNIQGDKPSAKAEFCDGSGKTNVSTTTKKSPDTTTKSSSNTTTAPKNGTTTSTKKSTTTTTTTKKSTTTSTTKNSTTTTKSTTTPGPKTTTKAPAPTGPTDITLVMKDGEKVCGLMELKVHFRVTYLLTNGSFLNVTVPLTNKTKDYAVTSTCTSNLSASVLFAFKPADDIKASWSFAIDFAATNVSSAAAAVDGGGKAKKEFWIKTLSLTYKPSGHLFPTPNETFFDNYSFSLTNQSLYKANVGANYICSSEEDVTLLPSPPRGGNLTVAVGFEKIRMQVFSSAKDFNKDGATECPTDRNRKTNIIVPIAVGVSLAVLVIIVVVAYIIGRKRRQSGYDQI